MADRFIKGVKDVFYVVPTNPLGRPQYLQFFTNEDDAINYQVKMLDKYDKTKSKFDIPGPVYRVNSDISKYEEEKNKWGNLAVEDMFYEDKMRGVAVVLYDAPQPTNESLKEGKDTKEDMNKKPAQEDIRWLYNWLEPTKESYLKGWEDGHAYIVFGAKNKLDDDGFNPENDWGIINALIERGFKYKLTQGDYTYKTVGTFNSRSMQAHNRGFDRTLKNRVRLDIYWGDNEEIDMKENMNKKPIKEDWNDDACNKVEDVLDDYGITVGDIVDNGNGTINLVGIYPDEWEEARDAIERELGFSVELPCDPEDAEIEDDCVMDELVVYIGGTNESLNKKSIKEDMNNFYTLSKAPVDIDTDEDDDGVSRVASIPFTLTDKGRERLKAIGWSTLFADKRKGTPIKDSDIKKTNVVVVEHDKDGEGGADVYIDINDYLDLIPVGDSDDFLIANNEIKYDEIEKMLDKYFATNDVSEAYIPNRQLIDGEWKTFKKGEVVPEYLWSAVCSGSVNTIKKYFEKGNKPNKRYPRFGTYHSLIMGALRNGRYDIAELLQSYGETVTDEEKEEYDDLMAQREERDRGKVVKESKQLTEAVDRDELAKFIEDSVDVLKNGGEGCWYKELGACASGVYLYCVVGFGLNVLDFAPSDVQHLATSKDGNSVICVKVAVNADDLQSDYDWDWAMPYSEATMDVWDTEVPVSKDENYTSLAQTLINAFNELKELNIDEDGVVIDTTVDESCKKKPIKEAKDDDDIRTVVYDVLHDHAPNGQVRDEMYDLMLNLTDRALSWLDDGSDIDGAVQQAIDDGMIYNDDQWTAYRHYCRIGDGEDAMWEGLYNDLGSILYIQSHEQPNLDDVDYEDEDEGAEDPMTGDDVWESLNTSDEE